MALTGVERAGSKIIKNVLLSALLVAGLTLSAGCGAARGRESYTVRLGGAQIAAELVDSWLGDAKSANFIVNDVGPIFMSQNGFQNLREGRCDIACTDRKITVREYADFGEQKLRGYRVAFYGFALYVNPENPIDSIYAGHLKLLFQRKLMDWKQLGTPFEGAIRLIGPEKSTRGGMILMQQARIWFDKPTWETLPSDRAIVQAVTEDPYALGFAGIGFDQEGARYVGLRMERTAKPAFPSLEEVESERYGLAKVIYLYMPAEPTPATDAVLEYLFSEDGRRSMESTQVWQIARERAQVELPK